MPRVNIYLNDERLAKSRMISNFSEFVGSAIDNYMPTKIQPRGEPKIKLVEPIIEGGKVIKIQTEKKDDKTYDFCKHDALKGFCKLGCK